MGRTEEITKKAPRALDLTQTRGTKNRKLTEEEREENRLLSKTRSRGEHIFLIAKRVFGFSKVRYKGVAKNTLLRQQKSKFVITGGLQFPLSKKCRPL